MSNKPKAGHLSSLWKDTTDSPSYSQIPHDSDDLPSPTYRELPSNSMVNAVSDSERTPPDNDLESKRRSVQFPNTVEVKAVDRESTYDYPGIAHSIADTDDGEDDEDYDWSTDEDLIDQEAKFEQQMGMKKRRKGWGPRRIATFFLSTLIGSTILSGLIVAIPLILHFFWFAPNPTDERGYITDNVSAWLYWAAANILLSWYLAMIVDIIPGVANMLIIAVWGEINETLRSRVELYNAAKDNVKPVLYGASCWVSWVIIFDGIFDLYDHANEANSRAHYTARTYQGIQFLFFFTLVLSIEKILAHLIAFAFHQKAFSERIEVLQHDLAVIDHLRSYRPKRTHRAHRSVFSSFPNLMGTPGLERGGFTWGLGGGVNSGRRSRPSTPDVTDEDGHVGDTELTVRDTKKKKTKRSWGIKSAFSSRQNSGRDSIEMDTADTKAPSDHPYDRHDNHKYPHKSAPTSVPGASRHSPLGPSGKSTPLQRNSDDDDEAVVVQAAKALKTAVLHDARNLKGKDPGNTGLGWDVTSAKEAKRVARSIYLAFKAEHHRRYLIPSDFYPAYPKRDDAEEAFKVFDVDSNGDISRAEIKTKILKVYKERRALTRSLRDVSKALRTLEVIMIFLAMIVLFFISLSVFNIGLGSSLTSFYTIGIAASFIFKNSASNAFDAVMFLFVTHPFDTGDRVFVDEENLVVKKMGLFATTFQRSDGTETYYFNSQLFNKFITNVRRSGKTFENVTVQVAWRTSLEKLDELERLMKQWLSTEENRWYDPGTAVTLQKIEYQKFLEFTLGVGHNGNWQDWGLRNARKTAFLAAVQYFCKQLGISFQESPLPVSLTDGDGQPLSLGPSLASADEPFSPGPMSPNDEVEEVVRESNKSVLGFIPPADARTTLTRIRKSKYKRGHLQAMAAGVDG